MKLCTYNGKRWLYLRLDLRGRELVDLQTGEPTWVQDESLITDITVEYRDFTVHRQDLHDRPTDWLVTHRNRRAEFTLASRKKSKKTTRATTTRAKKKGPTRARKPKQIPVEVLESLKGLPPDVRAKTLASLQGG